MANKFFAPIYEGNNGYYCFMPTTKFMRLSSGNAYEMPVWGKRCFPDRNHEQNLYIGIAEVTITKELENVAFFTAKMLPVKQPSNELLTEYLLNNPKMDGLNEASKMGMRLDFDVQDAVMVFYHNGNRSFMLYEYEGNIISIFSDTRYYEEKHSIRAYEFLSKQVLGATQSELLQDFVEFGYFAHNSKIPADIYVNDVFDDAIASELVVVYEVYGIKFVRFSEFDALSLLFSREEMDDIITNATNINKAANAAIEKKIRKGLIPAHKMSNGQISIDPRNR